MCQLAAGTRIRSYFDLLPTFDATMQVFKRWPYFFTALPLVLTLAQRRDYRQLLDAYHQGEDLVIPTQFNLNLVQLALEFHDDGGFPTITELQSIARVVIANVISVPLQMSGSFCGSMQVLEFEVGVMGRLPCKLNHSRRANTRLRWCDGVDADPAKPRVHPETGAIVLFVLIQVDTLVRCGEELTFDYGMSAQTLINGTHF